MNTWKTANAVVRHLEATIPGVRTCEGGLQLLEDLEAELTDAGFDVRQVASRRTLTTELRVRDDVDGWAR